MEGSGRGLIWYHDSIYLDGKKKTPWKKNQDSQQASQVSKCVAFKYKPDSLAPQPSCPAVPSQGLCSMESSGATEKLMDQL
jgi:hypothetical protein